LLTKTSLLNVLAQYITLIHFGQQWFSEAQVCYNSLMSKLDTAPYKGVRDFYPEDMVIQNYIFGVWKKVAEKVGYQEYSASPLEPTELYTEKSGDEIVREQTFTFIDRGDRSVTLRPDDSLSSSHGRRQKERAQVPSSLVLHPQLI
jgi:Histidyl-tRNA synthetase